MSIDKVIEMVSGEFLKWVDYTEKNSSAALKGRSYDNPGNYSEFAGKNNYTVFADLYKQKTGINVQGMAWCDTFVDTVFVHLFGVSDARRLLNGFSAYTPTSASFFKKAHAYYKSPSVGDVIFFRNSKRIYHTGYVYKVDSRYVYTVEGNTSAGYNVVVENGGAVAKKKYDLNNSRIDGYGRPNYAIIADRFTDKPKYEKGWKLAADGIRWWYQFGDGKYALNDGINNGWYSIDGRWYLFDKQGYMLVGHQEVNGQEYYLSTNKATEGALMFTNDSGQLYVK